MGSFLIAYIAVRYSPLYYGLLLIPLVLEENILLVTFVHKLSLTVNIYD